MKKVILVNDTRRDMFHIGSAQVIDNIKNLCFINNIEIMYSFLSLDISDKKFFLDALDGVEAVIINGEGTLHDANINVYYLMKIVEVACIKKKKIFLINTMWHRNHIFDKCLGMLDFISFRSNKDYLYYKNKIKVDMCHCPDLSLYYHDEDIKLGGQEKLNVLVSDSVNTHISKKLKKYAKSRGYVYKPMVLKTNVILLDKIISFFKSKYFLYLDMFMPCNINRKMKIKKLLSKAFVSKDDIQQSKYVITGRFHVVMFCIKYKVPFFYIKSNTPKIEQVINEIGLNCISINKDINNINVGYSSWNKVELDKLGEYQKYAQNQAEKVFTIIYEKLSRV